MVNEARRLRYVSDYEHGFLRYGTYPNPLSSMRKMAIPVARNLNEDTSVGYRLVMGVMEKA